MKIFEGTQNPSLAAIMVAGLLVAGIFSVTGCANEHNNPEAGSQEEQGAEADNMVVEVAETEESILANEVSESGEVTPGRQAVLVPQMPGQIEEIKAEEGDYLQKGEVILKTEATEQEMQLEQARSGLESMENEYEKMKKLHEAGALPASQIREMESELEQLEIQKDMARHALDSTQVEAPMDGVVVELDPSEGQLIGSEPIGRFMDLSSLNVRLTVDEGLVDYLYEGMEAEVAVSAADLETTGRVSRVADAAIQGSRFYMVEVRLDNYANRLRPGKFAQVTFALEEREGVEVESSAVREDEEEAIIFVVEDEVARERNIATGPRQDGKIEVMDGLAAGENYVVNPPADLEDGQDVSY